MMLPEDRIDTLDDTYVAVKKELAGATDTEYEFEGRFTTSTGEYDIFVLANVFGAYINDEGYIELHVRILEARGLPKEEDPELVDKIHETILDVFHGGNRRMDPRNIVVVPHIGPGAIKYSEDTGVGELEIKIVDLCRERDLTLEDTAMLLDRMLGRMVNMMADRNERESMTLEKLTENMYTRLTLMEKKEDINYIQ